MRRRTLAPDAGSEIQKEKTKQGELLNTPDAGKTECKLSEISKSESRHGYI